MRPLILTIILLLFASSVYGSPKVSGCAEPLVIFTEFGDDENAIRCVSSGGTITFVSGAGIEVAYLSPNSIYVAYVVSSGGYRHEIAELYVYDLSIDQITLVRSGDGHIVPAWIADDKLVITVYAEFPRPDSEVFRPDSHFLYDPATESLTELDFPEGPFTGYMPASRRFVLADFSHGLFSVDENGAFVDIQLPDEPLDPLGFSVSLDGNLILYRMACGKQANNHRNCFRVYNVQTQAVTTVDAFKIDDIWWLRELRISTSNRYVAVDDGYGRVSVYDLMEQRIVYQNSHERVSSGFGWVSDRDTLILVYLVDAGNYQSDSNLFALELPAGRLTQLTNTQHWKTYR